MDWVASVPAPLASVTEPHFIRLRQLHPVSSVRLPDGRVVYWGAPRESINRIAGQYPQPDVAAHHNGERRIGVRVPLACKMWYETGSSPVRKKKGTGRIIDMSSSGAFFTTESLLPRNTRVALHVSWPVRLEGQVPVELFAAGKVVRAEPFKAALRYDQIAFKVAT